MVPDLDLVRQRFRSLRLYNYHHRQRDRLLVFPAEDAVAGEATAGAGSEPNFLIHRSTKGIPDELARFLVLLHNRDEPRSLCAV